MTESLFRLYKVTFIERASMKKDKVPDEFLLHKVFLCSLNHQAFIFSLNLLIVK